MAGNGQEKQGFWIVVDGGDRVGKTTQINRLTQLLKATGQDVVNVRDPGGSPAAESIRSLLLEGPGPSAGQGARWHPDTELALFTAARIEAFDQTIRPNLKEGRVVVTDRWVSSTRAYQCFDASQRAKFDALNAAFGLDAAAEPDLTVILDGGESALARIDAAAAEGGPETHFEARGRAYHAGVQERYRQFCREAPERRVLIDAESDVDTVSERIREAVAPHFRQHGIELDDADDLCARAS